jgi:hypothetical protein
MNILYEIKQIPFKGYGIISKQIIKKGEIIWNLNNDKSVISISDLMIEDYLKKFNDKQIIYIFDHMFCFNGICYDIQYSDNRFTNHSNNPTSFVDKDGNSVASRDINIGEEITEDYTTYDNYLPNYYRLMVKYIGKNFTELPNDWN